MATLTRERDSLAKQLSGSTAAFEEKLQGVKEACMCLHENLEHIVQVLEYKCMEFTVYKDYSRTPVMWTPLGP